jgi:hypothetical protein
MARIPGPECGHSKPCFIDPGTMCRSLTPVPSPAGCHPLLQPARRPPAPIADDPFSGTTPYDQARSLLRPVRRGCAYGAPLRELPQPLGDLVGKTVNLSVNLCRNYLAKEGIKEHDIGGSLDVAIPRPRYFVIHDTSSKIDGATAFPRNINESSWASNRMRSSVRPANVFVTRVGTSFTHSDFSHTELSTKYVIKYRHKSDQFLNTELIQPRISGNSRGTGDAIAPQPGFPACQLERLAVIYIAASLRHGYWLVPAFHAVVDYEFRNRSNMHDDPQNFSLDAWAELLGAALKAIHGIRPAGEDLMGRAVSQG